MISLRPSAPRAGFSAKRAGVFAAIAAAALVSGCASTETTTERYDLTHPIAVDIAPTMLELPADATLSHFDGSRVDAFARDFLKTADGEITIAYPSDQKTSRVVSEAAARLARNGVPSDRVIRGPYSREKDGDRGVVLSYYSAVATPAPCPEAQRDTTNDRRSATPLSFGCAYQNNVAVMLEQPRDAIAPRPATPPSADRRHHVLVNYTGGQATASEPSQERVATTDE